MKELVEYLQKKDILKTPALIDAFLAIDREDFTSLENKRFAQADEALSIGSGQTISQPYVVAFMLEQLMPRKGQRILDIGTGSGWTTALLAYIVGKTGKVIGIEILPELAEFAKTNVAKYNFIEKGIVVFICANGAQGYKEKAPFDSILVSASLATKKIPTEWKEQLKENGKIVVPIQDSIWVFTKTKTGEFIEEEYPGFVFVPFV